MHHFKLYHNSTTRRISFPELPTWQELAGKIELVCNIPFEKIAVSYVDIDGDEITLNSQEELDDYYTVTHKAGNSIRFVVQDLGALRHPESKDKSLPETPRDSVRNTFGVQPLDGEDDDEEWQRLPNIFMSGLGPRLEPTHAYIEVVDSDATSGTSIGNKAADQTFDDSMSTSSEELAQEAIDKGKSRQAEIESVTDKASLSSTGSLIANNAPTKFPVHVYDRSADIEDLDSIPVRTSSPFFPAHTASAPSTVHGVPAESTPKVNTQVLSSASVDHQSEAVPDPPLADLPAIDTPSILNDAANLLNTITSHPEFKKITTNAANGNYWVAHREAISRAASELSRATQEPGRAAYQEAEAGKRLAEALGSVFKSFVAPNPSTAEPATVVNAWKLWADKQQQASPKESSPAAADRDLRAEVEAAKEAYKQAKERYREDREARKKQKDEKQRLIKLIAGIPPSALPTVPPAAPFVTTTPNKKPEVHLVSNARGGYPELEMFSVPMKTQPVPKQTQTFKTDQTGEALFLRSLHRILKRLGDMGFTDSDHPTLQGRIKSMLPPSGTTKDREDEIVTTLLESLLDQSSAAAGANAAKQPVASGSGVPGAWR